MNFAEIAMKFLLGLMAMVTIINMTGKGNLAPTSAMEQIMNYVLGGIIGGVIYSRDVRIWQFAIVLIIWFVLVYGMRRLKSRSHLLQHLLDGTPTVVIVNGQVDVAACKRAKITARELTLKLRLHNVFNIRKVKRALVEQNGQLLLVMAGEENLKYPLLTDGVAQSNVLEAIDKDVKWLREELAKQGYDDLSKLFLVDYLGGQLVVTPYT